MLSPHEILHEDNYNALCVAICYKSISALKMHFMST